MSPGKSASAASKDLLADLRRSLAATDAAAQRACIAALGVPAEHVEGFGTRAQLVVQRASARVPAASATEIELALGVLVALSTPARAAACT